MEQSERMLAAGVGLSINVTVYAKVHHHSAAWYDESFDMIYAKVQNMKNDPEIVKLLKAQLAALLTEISEDKSLIYYLGASGDVMLVSCKTDPIQARFLANCDLQEIPE